MKDFTRVVTVFGSSRPRQGDPQYALACELGAELAARRLVVCSGGYGGVMEGVSRGAKQAHGRTLGVTARFFKARRNPWIDEEIVVDTWQARLFELIDRGQAYIVCPGGTGTMVELAVVWEMLNKRAMHEKPLVILGDFWRPVIDRVREVELGHDSEWGENQGPLIEQASSPAHAAQLVAGPSSSGPAT